MAEIESNGNSGRATLRDLMAMQESTHTLIGNSTQALMVRMDSINTKVDAANMKMDGLAARLTTVEAKQSIQQDTGTRLDTLNTRLCSVEEQQKIEKETGSKRWQLKTAILGACTGSVSAFILTALVYIIKVHPST